MKFRDFKNDRYFQEYLRKKEEEKRLTEEKRKKRIIQQNRERRIRYQLWLQQQQLNQIGEFASTSVSTPSVSIDGPIVTDGLIFHIDAANTDSYPGSGTTVSDLIGSNDGTLNNGVSFTSDNRGSFILDGVDDYISVLDNDAFSFGSGGTDSPFSMSVWVNMVDATDFRMMSKLINVGGREYWFGTTSDDTVFFILFNSLGDTTFVYVKSTSPLTSFENTWINVTVTYDGRGGTLAYNGQEIYVNGQLQSKTTFRNGFFTAMGNKSAPLEIGALSDLGSYANGKLSVAKVYNKELSASEVLQNYNALSGRYT